MKNCTIRITDVENGYVLTVQRFMPKLAPETEGGLLGFLTGHSNESAQRTIVCKSWTEVLSTLAALDESMTAAGL